MINDLTDFYIALAFNDYSKRQLVTLIKQLQNETKPEDPSMHKRLLKGAEETLMIKKLKP